MATQKAPSPRSRRKRAYHHGDLRAALVRATFDQVRRAGPQAVTLRGVAAAAGVSEAAPYHHVRDKTELLALAAAEGYLLLGRAFETACAGHRGSAAAVLVRLADAYVRFALDEPGAFRLMFGTHMLELTQFPETRAAAQAARLYVGEWVDRFVAESGARAPAARVFQMLWAQIHGTAWLVLEQEIRDDTLDAPALAQQGVRHLLADLARAPA